MLCLFVLFVSTSYLIFSCCPLLFYVRRSKIAVFCLSLYSTTLSFIWLIGWLIDDWLMLVFSYTAHDDIWNVHFPFSGLIAITMLSVYVLSHVPVFSIYETIYSVNQCMCFKKTNKKQPSSKWWCFLTIHDIGLRCTPLYNLISILSKHRCCREPPGILIPKYRYPEESSTSFWHHLHVLQ